MDRWTLFALVAFVLAACASSNSNNYPDSSVGSDVVDAQTEKGDNDTTDGKYPEADDNAEPEADVAEGEVNDVGGSDVESDDNAEPEADVAEGEVEDDVGGSDVESDDNAEPEADVAEGEVEDDVGGSDVEIEIVFKCQEGDPCDDGSAKTADFCGFVPQGSECQHINTSVYNMKFVDEDIDEWYTTTSDMPTVGMLCGDNNDCVKAVTQSLKNLSPNKQFPDCDDTNVAVHPGVTEVCSNDTDDNCDGQTDEGECIPLPEPQPEELPEVVEEVGNDVDPNFQCQEGDPCDDGSAKTADFCGFVPQGSECQHINTSVYNMKFVDEDIDEWYTTTSDMPTVGMLCGDNNDCVKAVTQSLKNLSPNKQFPDCDDTNVAVHPGVTEVYDGKDNDCDGSLGYDECQYPDAGCGLGPSYACSSFQCLF